jgi:hypothetical protein
MKQVALLHKTLLSVSILLLSLQSYSQIVQDTSARKDKALKVFLDCQYCDMDYLRTEITFINYVRDRMEAQVDVIASSIPTGSGGTKYTFVFKGQKEFSGKSDTLEFDAKSFETDDGRRVGMAQIIKLGLARYVARTPFACMVNISCRPDTAQLPAMPPTDKWKSWVFNININGNINSQDLTTTSFIFGSVSVSKVTPDWKVSFAANANYNRNYYVVPDSTITSFANSQSLNGQFVKSISNHLSWGLNASASSSTYANTLLSEKIAPGIEYSVFPYSQATHRLLTFLYSVYSVNYRYIDTTIYGKIQQLLYGESLTASISFKQPWGSLSTAITGSHYFQDFSKNNLSIFASLNLNIFQGFSVNFFGSASLVHDQVFLPAAGATEAEILLQTKTLATTYYYFTGIGFTYTFGSIFNNVVNPRFNGASGGNYSISTMSME